MAEGVVLYFLALSSPADVKAGLGSGSRAGKPPVPHGLEAAALVLDAELFMRCPQTVRLQSIHHGPSDDSVVSFLLENGRKVERP